MSSTPDKPQLKLRRVYEPASPTDGARILVDRLWPRGLRKQDAAIDHWFKDLAPSTTLRQWFGHKPERWTEFRKRYRAELAEQVAALTQLQTLARKAPITLLFAAHDQTRNNAVVLYELLDAKEHKARPPVKAVGKTRRQR